ncbi:MAG: helix-turn-helix domain-containing protein [Thaumarchaeota archaeon]|nr:helix-turn-helix domain-containing protein [Nitrososphaerota archaeon]
MSVMEVSKKLGVSESTIRRWIKKEKLKSRLRMQSYRFSQNFRVKSLWMGFCLLRSSLNS